MEEETENISSEEIPSDPELLDEIYSDEEPFFTLEQKLDEDFNCLLALLPIIIPPIEDAKEKGLCEDWLNRLVGMRTKSLDSKRDRNLYLINLMLNMGNGSLTSPFNQPPPKILEQGLLMFSNKAKPELCYQNLEIEVEDFAEYSKDGRTFFAAKSLPAGKGTFGYLGVSIGGGDALWLNCKGEHVDPKHLIRKTACVKETRETKEQYRVLKHVISKRSPQKDHTELITYYKGLLERIEDIISYYGTDHEIFDPVVEKMLEDMQTEIIQGGHLEFSEISCRTKKEWLSTLKQTIEKKLQDAEEREVTLNNLEQIILDHEKDEITFLDVSKAVKPPTMDPILAEAARDRPSDYNVTMLKSTYPDGVVYWFLKLLEQEKINIINKERLLYQNFVSHLRSEVLDEVRRGLNKYTIARQEFRHISKVMKKVDETKNIILLKEVERITATDDPEFHEKDDLINNEIKSAKCRLEEAQVQSDVIEGKVAKLHEQVYQLTSEFQNMEEDGRRESELFLKEISDLEYAIASQQRKLLMLQHKNAEKKEAEACLSK